jgi:UDP-3-O-[3-hydroxymyristoyl] N-acetylglucosamine deacetylase/3-hydroxyacyl-[acyl-carrier-protein] dehydratase
VLDAIGDLYLIGAPVQCRVLASRAGHGLNRRLGLEIVQRIKTAHQAASLSSRQVMDARTISRLLPHRYPMLLVDRVLELDGNRRAVGVKNVTMNEPFFPGHYPGQPIMPGVLIVEAMAQLSGLLLAQTLEHTGKVAVLMSLDGVRLRHPVSPGDQLLMEAETLTANSRAASVLCRGSVAGKTVAEAKIRFMMVDADAEPE